MTGKRTIKTKNCKCLDLWYWLWIKWIHNCLEQWFFISFDRLSPQDPEVWFKKRDSMLTQEITHIFCVFTHWNHQNFLILTVLKSGLTFLRFYEQGFMINCSPISYIFNEVIFISAAYWLMIITIMNVE